jgi:REP element-mobilizing transposase RayT
MNITTLQPNTYYHIYNRAVGKEKGFVEEKNYPFFLGKLKQYITPIAKVYAYCLLPNHYHLFVKIKTEEEIDTYKTQLNELNKILGNFETSESFIVKQFSNMNNSYTKSFNKTYDRKGKLFLQSFKRKEVDSDEYYTKLIHYIHSNPVHHQLVKQIKDWKHSSYNALLSTSATLLQRDEVLNWFRGRDKFIIFHQETHISIHE